MKGAARPALAARRRRLAWIAPPAARASSLLAFGAGVLTVFAFAPFTLTWLPAAALGLLFMLWQSASPGHATRLGFAFGTGLFFTGVSWVYVALNTFGGMPAPVAALGTALFCLYLALFPAVAGFVAARWTAPRSWARVLVAAAAWTIAEWARSWGFSGFPWLAMGYAALPLASPAGPLGGFAPVGGVWLVSLAYALLAASATMGIEAAMRSDVRRVVGAALTGLAVVGAGLALRPIAWTQPTGSPLAVSLVQGNVRQDEKFDLALRDATFSLYVDLARASRGRLIVLPESALPAFADEVPVAVLRNLLDIAVARDGLLLTGLFTVEPPEPGQEGLRYYNSVLGIGGAMPQVYRKRHLVPFGETIPLEPIVGWFIRSVLSIPLANQSAGAAAQPAFVVAHQAIAVNICYEDVFGSDIRPQAESATILVNVTNDAWYGRSLAAEQHNQIAAMRALESGRPLLRATNTGITSFLGHDGREQARLPWYTRGTLELSVTGRNGLTPYVRYGDGLPLTLAAVLLIAALALAQHQATDRASRHQPLTG
ncbi:MAG: apolipoprotein N-acyltransferase [Casimicrobiaceae bacterium]